MQSDRVTPLATLLVTLLAFAASSTSDEQATLDCFANATLSCNTI